MTSPGLAILFSDGSLSVLSPATQPAEALDLCEDANASEPRRDRQARVVRLAWEIVEDVFQDTVSTDTVLQETE